MGKKKRPRRTEPEWFYENLQRLGFDSYKDYLRSRHWMVLRGKILRRDGCCRVCSGPARAIHHRTYRRLGRELFVPRAVALFLGATIRD